jgi:hypothetical protein
LPTQNRQYVTSTANVNPVVYDSRRRSIYLPIVRSAVYELLQAFDFPDPSTMHGTRESTTVASQALFMLNSKLVAGQSRSLAERILATDESDALRVRRVFGELLNRMPTAEDELRFLRIVEHLEGSLSTSIPDASERHRRAWQIACRTLMSSNPFLYLD